MISIAFVLFFAAVFLLHWLVAGRAATWQNLLLLVSSLVFYAWMDLRFLGLTLLLIFSNYLAGLGIAGSTGGKKQLFFYSGILLNLGVLLVFRYVNFLLPVTGIFYPAAGEHVIPNLLVPLGISFYTLQAIGYLSDVRKDDAAVSRDPVIFAVYLCYFGKIVAGPIERSSGFLAQLGQQRVFDYSLAVAGARQVLWGLFVKLVVAGNCAFIAEPIFRNRSQYPGSSLIIAAFFYSFEVYADFSGYSNLAIGLSKLLGLRLSKNFAAPFFALDIREFWSRWHITLTAWMNIYVFTPISFYLRRWRRTGIIISTAISFILIGVWHGSNLTYLLFGSIHALYFTVFILMGSGRNKSSAGAGIIVKRCLLFFCVMIALVAFGSQTVPDAIGIWKTIFSASLFSRPLLPELVTLLKLFFTSGAVAFLLTTEYRQLRRRSDEEFPVFRKPAARAAAYVFLIAAILLTGSTVHIDFIYSQF